MRSRKAALITKLALLIYHGVRVLTASAFHDELKSFRLDDLHYHVEAAVPPISS